MLKMLLPHLFCSVLRYPMSALFPPCYWRIMTSRWRRCQRVKWQLLKLFIMLGCLIIIILIIIVSRGFRPQQSFESSAQWTKGNPRDNFQKVIKSFLNNITVTKNSKIMFLFSTLVFCKKKIVLLFSKPV